MIKRDLKKELKHLYGPGLRDVVRVDVPAMNFLMIDGKGNPNTSQKYRDAVECLYALSYTLKFMIKKAKGGVDYGVMPLEGLWWADDMAAFEMEKKDLPTLSLARLEAFHEGQSAQIMYLGPYSAEGPTIRMIHAFIKEQGGCLAGKHHEIYLGDARRTAPEKLKTVIRQPFEISHR